MSSSTSSSELEQRRKTLVAILFFLSSFAGMVCLGEMLPRGARNEFYLWQRSVWLDSSWRLTKNGGQLEVLPRDNPFIENARQADVLLLGNSMIMHAFRTDQVQRLEQQTGARVFQLGFGFKEGYEFALKLIRDHDLRPKMVVVHVGDFFEPGLSEVALEAIAEGRVPEGTLARWRRAIAILEDRGTRKLKAVVQPWLPRWSKVLPVDRESWQIHRSTANGTWRETGFDAVGWSRPMAPEWKPEEPYPLSPTEQAAVHEFGEEMDRRGAVVVLTLVPHSGVIRARAQSVAEALEAPLVAPRLSGLSTLDGYHLDRESAVRFVTAFLEEFTALDEFRDLREALVSAERPITNRLPS